jgi:hypothetical protein
VSFNDFQQNVTFLESYLDDEHYDIADSLEIRRDMVTFLQFIQKNKVVGTQSTGNMPLKMISQLSKELVNPPDLEEKIGDRIYKVRSEYEVWAIYFLHVLAEVGDLVKISPGKQWKVTKASILFLDSPALIQLGILLFIWWKKVNWLVAFQVSGIGDDLPVSFIHLTLNHLLLNVDKASVSFKEFADKLIRDTGLTWTSEDTTHHQMFLRGAIESIVIDIHVEFGLMEAEYEDYFIGSYKTNRIVSFKMTEMGKMFIELIRLSFF